MARPRKARGDDLPPAITALLDRMRAVRESILADARPRVSNEEIVAQLVSAGLPPKMAERLEASLAGKPVQERARERLAEIVRMNDEGMPDGAIACELGLSRSYVCMVRRANGVPAARRRR